MLGKSQDGDTAQDKMWRKVWRSTTIFVLIIQCDLYTFRYLVGGCTYILWLRIAWQTNFRTPINSSQSPTNFTPEFILNTLNTKPLRKYIKKTDVFCIQVIESTNVILAACFIKKLPT